MWLDIINGLFEFFGSFFTWKNAYKLFKDKKIKGVYIPTWIFFTIWGLWNLIYYPSLNQWYSLIGGILIVSGNLTWSILAIYYTKIKENNVVKY